MLKRYQGQGNRAGRHLTSQYNIASRLIPEHQRQSLQSLCKFSFSPFNAFIQMYHTPEPWIRLQMAINANRLVRLDNPIVWARMDALQQQLEDAMRD